MGPGKRLLLRVAPGLLGPDDPRAKTLIAKAIRAGFRLKDGARNLVLYILVLEKDSSVGP
jgi:hypothetical protein